MMKFKHRITAVVCVIMIGIPYFWFKYKWSPQRSPVVKIYEEALLQTLLLDDAFDFNKLDHRHENTRLSRTARRSTSFETGGSHTTSSKHTIESTISTLRANAIPFTVKRTTLQTPMVADTANRNPWEIWKGMVTLIGTKVTPNGTLGSLQVNAVLKALRSFPIVNVGVGFKGSQLKASMFLEGSQRTVFKPKRFVCGCRRVLDCWNGRTNY